MLEIFLSENDEINKKILLLSRIHVEQVRVNQIHVVPSLYIDNAVQEYFTLRCANIYFSVLAKNKFKRNEIEVKN
jgi:hypothetical protein